MPALLRARARRAHRPVAGLAARPARAGRRAADQQRGRPHELRDDRDGPADRTRSTWRACRAARSSCAGRAPGETVTTLDGEERTLPGRIGVIGGTRGRARRWPGSWAAPRARSRTPRARSRSRPPTGTPLAIRRGGQGARHAHGGLAPFRARRRSRGAAHRPRPASRTCWRRSARARVRPGLIDRTSRRVRARA